MKPVVHLVGVCTLLLHLAFSQTTSGKKRLTIEAIFAEGGITGREPETIKWSPDGSKFSFIQRDDSGEHGELWYVDAASGEKKVLVSEVKLAGLAPPVGNCKTDRASEYRTLYDCPTN